MRQKNKKGIKRSLKVISLKVVTLLAFIFLLSTVSAQESINATGGDASGSGGSASYSVGQIVYTTDTSTTGSVSKGVQQPYEILVVTGIEEFKGITLQCFAYPNPTTDFLQLKVENEKLQDLNYQLFDINGKLLETKKVSEAVTSISMLGLSMSTYFLKLSDNNKELKTFKIIKN